MRQNEVNNIESLEEYYHKYTKLKFSNEIIISSLEQVIFSFLLSLENTYYTNNKLQCKKYKDRSFHDLIRICKYYFPEITVKEIFSELKKLGGKLNKLQEKGFHFRVYCPTINRSNISCSLRPSGYLETNKYDKILILAPNFIKKFSLNDIINT